MRSVLLVMVAIVSVAAMASGCRTVQVAEPGTVAGVVVSTSGLSVYGATVISTGTGQAVTTDRSGAFVISGIPSGKGALTVTKPGYQGKSITITVKAHDTITVNTVLSPNPGSARVEGSVVFGD